MRMKLETLKAIMDEALDEGDKEAVLHHISTWEKFRACVEEMEDRRTELKSLLNQHEAALRQMLKQCQHWTRDSEGVCHDCSHIRKGTI